MSFLIALDGIDASGKTTQAEFLRKKFTSLGKKVLNLSFPNYENESSTLVKLYLSGKLGDSAEAVNAYAASSFFACDRYINYVNDWSKYYKNSQYIIIANRYTTANAIHQLCKINRENWRKYLDWLWDYEFEKLELPKPDLVVFFDMHIDVAIKLIEEREKLTNSTKDIHEKDLIFLQKSYEAGKYAAEYLNWEVLTCWEFEKNNLNLPVPKSREQISEDLFKLVNEKLC